MRKQHWPKRDPVKNYFPLPNEIFSLGLSAGAIAVYGFLLHREDRRTYQCVASYRIIGEAVGMSVNTVRKYVTELEDRGLIRTERTTVTTRDGEELHLNGLYIGDSRVPFEKACELAQELNIVHVERRAKKVVTYLDPEELKTTWVGNKGVYRTRMIVADGGDLIILAPGPSARMRKWTP